MPNLGPMAQVGVWGLIQNYVYYFPSYFLYKCLVVGLSCECTVFVLRSVKKTPVSAVRSALVLLSYTIWHLQCSMAGPKYHPYNTHVSQYFCCPGFLWISTLVPGGERAVLLKSNFPFSTTYAEGFGFDISVLNMFNVIGS